MAARDLAPGWFYAADFTPSPAAEAARRTAKDAK